MEDTAKQIIIITEVCNGKSNTQIAETLGIKEKTVKFHLTNIFKNHSVKSRSQLIIQVLKEQITDDEMRRFKKILLEA